MRKGVSLYLALIVLATVTSLIFAVTNVVVFQAKYLTTRSFSIKAYFGAEAGVEKGLFELSELTEGSTRGSLGGVVYEVLYCTPGRVCSSEEIKNYICNYGDGVRGATSFCVVGVGTFKETRRAIEILF